MRKRGLKVWNFVLISYFFHICVIAPAAGQISPAADLSDQYLPLLEGKRVGLAVNHSSLVRGVHLADFLLGNDIEVVRIFAPEHGFRGTASDGEIVDNSVDKSTGVPVVSLYSSSKKLQAKDISDLDVVVFDIQDVGVRFYTYISTLHYIMETCAEEGVKLIVLDRPNPNGYYIDGPVLKEGYSSFIGMHPIPVVYGLTVGELALMINGEGWLADDLKCDLTVIPCTGYDHTMTFDLPVAPSPNLPNQRAVLLYPSLCFFEGTTVSIGRGTDKQFQVLGHPDFAIGSFMFTPLPNEGSKHPKHEGKLLSGTSLLGLSVDDIMSWKMINLQWLTGYYEYLHSRGDVFFDRPDYFDKLAGSDQLRKQIIAGLSENEIRDSWQEDLRNFNTKRKKYLLYPDFEMQY